MPEVRMTQCRFVKLVGVLLWMALNGWPQHGSMMPASRQLGCRNRQGRTVGGRCAVRRLRLRRKLRQLGVQFLGEARVFLLSDGQLRPDHAPQPGMPRSIQFQFLTRDIAGVNQEKTSPGITCFTVPRGLIEPEYTLKGRAGPRAARGALPG